jgi:hypothetical protein
VLEGLFHGNDAQLVSTGDGPLARATAQALLSIAEKRPRLHHRLGATPGRSPGA